MKNTIKPDWIRGRLSVGDSTDHLSDVLERLSLNSVCVEADCPNRGECWEKAHVTFLLLGDVCTRKCLFCNVKKHKPLPPDDLEPERIAEAVKELDIKYLVLTSVTRDDLKDKGVLHYSRTVESVKKRMPEVAIELLIPDLNADERLVEEISKLSVNVIGHNIEIPRSLYPKVRSGSDYDRSLKTLKLLNACRVKSRRYITKSSIMLGLGEKRVEIIETFDDLRTCSVDIVYMGQYLSPSKEHWPVEKYYTPDEFRELKNEAISMGFKTVYSDPMVRSSYRAKEAYMEACRKQ